MSLGLGTCHDSAMVHVLDCRNRSVQLTRRHFLSAFSTITVVAANTAAMEPKAAIT